MVVDSVGGGVPLVAADNTVLDVGSLELAALLEDPFAQVDAEVLVAGLVEPEGSRRKAAQTKEEAAEPTKRTQECVENVRWEV